MKERTTRKERQGIRREKERIGQTVQEKENGWQVSDERRRVSGNIIVQAGKAIHAKNPSQ